MMCFMAGISTSPPSSPNRFSEDHFLARNDSNLPRKAGGGGGGQRTWGNKNGTGTDSKGMEGVDSVQLQAV